MPQIQKAQPNASQNFTLPDGKIVVSRALLREILQLLSMTTPLVGAPRPPERHWSALNLCAYSAPKSYSGAQSQMTITSGGMYD